MDHTIVHFEIPADDLDRAAKFYREVFGWEIARMPGPFEYFGVRTTATDETGMPKGPGVNGGMMKRMHPGQCRPTTSASRTSTPTPPSWSRPAARSSCPRWRSPATAGWSSSRTPKATSSPSGSPTASRGLSRRGAWAAPAPITTPGAAHATTPR